MDFLAAQPDQSLDLVISTFAVHFMDRERLDRDSGRGRWWLVVTPKGLPHMINRVQFVSQGPSETAIPSEYKCCEHVRINIDTKQRQNVYSICGICKYIIHCRQSAKGYKIIRGLFMIILELTRGLITHM